MPQPLRPYSRDGQDESSSSPEALMISALLEQGEFDPTPYRVTAEDLSCMQQLWTYCEDHQQRTGRAPSFDLIAHQFPDFTIVADVDPYWAADRLRKAAAGRVLRTKVMNTLAMLGEDDVDSAYAELADLASPTNVRRPPVTLFDKSTFEDDVLGIRVPVPYTTLGRATGGIGQGQMWCYAMRTGQGKTQQAAVAFAPEAVKGGFSVGYFSCEMQATEIVQLVRRGMAAWDQTMVSMLDSTDREIREGALDMLQTRTVNTGDFAAYDPSHGRITVEAVRDALEVHDLVFVDHIELMQLKDGRRASDDWRVLAEISNRLKEEVLRTKGRLLILAQTNRSSVSQSPERCPKLDEISGSDHIPRDCDVVVTGQRYSDSVHKHEAVKVRRGPLVSYYTTYKPGRPEFKEISKAKAEQIASMDEDRRAGF